MKKPRKKPKPEGMSKTRRAVLVVAGVLLGTVLIVAGVLLPWIIELVRYQGMTSAVASLSR